jgi:hypothetical protein
VGCVLMESKLRTDLEELFSSGGYSVMALENAQNAILEKNVGKALNAITNGSFFLRRLDEFIDVYEDFIASVDRKFGVAVGVSLETMKRLSTELKNDLKNIIINISTDKNDLASQIIADSIKSAKLLERNIAIIYAVPNLIDLSKLDHKDWKRIGKLGIHYRGKVFLSYAFRDKEPAKDENQKFVDYLIKPLLNLLDIEPITARSHLNVQENLEEGIMALILDSDGIIGFFTVNDPTQNIEHEISFDDTKIVAICKEEGANYASMRRAKLQIDFKRSEPSQLLLDLIKALKEKKFFSLKV